MEVFRITEELGRCKS